MGFQETSITEDERLFAETLEGASVGSVLWNKKENGALKNVYVGDKKTIL